MQGVFLEEMIGFEKKNPNPFPGQLSHSPSSLFLYFLGHLAVR
jgi:hypothetical protein